MSRRPAQPPIEDREIESQIFACLADRDEMSSCCPSEVARLLAPLREATWRSLMPRIRGVLATLVETERVRITRGGENLTDMQNPGGPIRIRRGPKFSSPWSRKQG